MNSMVAGGHVNSMVVMEVSYIVLTPAAMVVANSTSTHVGIWSVNDRWSGLIVQVRMKLCGH